ncbi:MAG: MBL fold metallo-hydrolase, partial [Planctomycetes bacterium]|nr:MBL fold metallo-hydrolase [Planctomycetota bacterium]
DVEGSKALNNQRSGIILSASGMCEGGRILHHLKQSIDRPEDVVCLVGFQAEGTLGRKLIEDYDTVKIYGVRYGVQCRVRSFEGLSAHADSVELLEHLRPLAPIAEQTFVVHGEENACMRFAGRLEGAGFRSVEVPLYKERFTLIP